MAAEDLLAVVVGDVADTALERDGLLDLPGLAQATDVSRSVDANVMGLEPAGEVPAVLGAVERRDPQRVDVQGGFQEQRDRVGPGPLGQGPAQFKERADQFGGVQPRRAGVQCRCRFAAGAEGLPHLCVSPSLGEIDQHTARAELDRVLGQGDDFLRGPARCCHQQDPIAL
jgi:hypothetical protein